jgi:hypothetical protein
MSMKKFLKKDILTDWIFWIGVVMVLGACTIAAYQTAVGILVTPWGWATALLVVGTGVACLGISRQIHKANLYL